MEPGPANTGIEGALLNPERLWRHVVDSGIIGLASWDVGGRIYDANDAFLQIVGYSRSALAAGDLDWRRLTPKEWQEVDARAILQLQRHGIATPIDKEYVRKDGTRVWVRLRSVTLEHDATKALSLVVDISEQKRAQRERDELLERERIARAEAEAAVQSRDEILGIVSHDLRNPLNTIAIRASMLEMPLPDEQRAEQAAIIRRAIEKMNRLIQDLLDVNQIASGRLRVEPVPAELAPLLEEAHSMFQLQLAQKNQHFDCQVPQASAVVLADRIRVLQVLANLVGNASKFTPEGGCITLRAEPRQRDVLLSVSDTGPGIDQQDLPQLFDRFWQARRVRRGGVGLGLAISRGIVEAHGGRIWVESSPGQGTTFFFTLSMAT